MNATENNIQQTYWWIDMCIEISDYIRRCNHCGKSKAYTQPPPLTLTIILKGDNE